MIEREYGHFVLTCDHCYEDHPDTPFKTFEAAKEAASKDGWKTTLEYSRFSSEPEYLNYCPDCAKEEKINDYHR